MLKLWSLVLMRTVLMLITVPWCPSSPMRWICSLKTPSIILKATFLFFLKPLHTIAHTPAPTPTTSPATTHAPSSRDRHTTSRATSYGVGCAVAGDVARHRTASHYVAGDAAGVGAAVAGDGARDAVRQRVRHCPTHVCTLVAVRVCHAYATKLSITLKEIYFISFIMTSTKWNRKSSFERCSDIIR